jgi:AAA domain
LHFVVQPVDLIGGADVIDLAKAIRYVGGTDGVVILDTLNRAAPGADENSSKDMGIILAAAKQLQLLVGGLVLMVHHTGKDPEKGMRGHSSLFAALDGAIGVTKSVNGPVWTVTKSKDDATGAIYSFNLEIVVVGVDEDGEDITSCVAVPVAAPFALRSTRKLAPNQQIALDALHELFNGKGEVDARLEFEEAVQAVAAKLQNADQKHKRERAKEAIEGLIKKSLICSDDQYLWLKPS